MVHNYFGACAANMSKNAHISLLGEKLALTTNGVRLV